LKRFLSLFNKMKNRFLSLVAVPSVVFLTTSALAQDHGHLNVGAVSTNQDAQLIFDNGPDFATDANYVKTLDYATTGTYAGYHQGNITLTALAATPAHLGPVPNAPALGSWIHAQIVAVDGPPGGAFAFWNTGATSPTISLATGSTGTNMFVLSENNGVAGTDPFGHIHGRRLTATKPGIYAVSFRAFDLSANGTGGGPIHAPSGTLKVYFQAGVQIMKVKPEITQSRVTFGAKAGFVWQLEAVNSLPGGTNWQAVGSSILGDDYFHEVLDNQAVINQRYFRVTGVPYSPP
jgi:hypothetical protein